MKINKELKIIFIVLLITLICLISFMGINIEQKGIMKNLIPQYKLGMDLDGYRVLEYEIDESKKETLNEDAQDNSDGEEISSIQEEKSTDVENPDVPGEGDDASVAVEDNLVNPMESRNNDNYEKCKELMIARLKKLGVENYIVRVDNKTGKIVINLPENEGLDEIVSVLTSVGKLEIKDTETGEILMNNNDLKNVSVGYSQGENGISVYLNIQFNKDGKAKLKDITTTYSKIDEKTKSQDGVLNEVDNNVVSNQEESLNDVTSETETSTNSVANEIAETATTEQKEKTITMYIDDEEIMSTSFENKITNGVLQLSIGSVSTNQSDIQEYYKQGNQMASGLNYGNMPLKYNMEGNRYVKSDITDLELSIIISCGIIVLTAMCIYMLVKYKENGLSVSILFIGFIAFYLLILKYTNVVLTMEGLAGIAMIGILAFIFNINLLKNKNYDSKSINKIIIKTIYKYIPLFIIAIVVAFSNWTPIGSFGMVTFWGLLWILLYNFLVTKSLFKNLSE